MKKYHQTTFSILSSAIIVSIQNISDFFLVVMILSIVILTFFQFFYLIRIAMQPVNINIQHFKAEINGFSNILQNMFLRVHALDMYVSIAGLLSAAGKATRIVLQHHLLTQGLYPVKCLLCPSLTFISLPLVLSNRIL